MTLYKMEIEKSNHGLSNNVWNKSSCMWHTFTIEEVTYVFSAQAVVSDKQLVAKVKK